MRKNEEKRECVYMYWIESEGDREVRSQRNRFYFSIILDLLGFFFVCLFYTCICILFQSEGRGENPVGQ